MTGIVFVYVTHPDPDAAAALGRKLVEDGLAACVNILPGMRTVYRWQGAIEEAGEAVMIVKTRADLVAALRERVRAEHPYECPCIAALPVAGGDPDYLAWIAQSCGNQAWTCRNTPWRPSVPTTLKPDPFKPARKARPSFLKKEAKDF